MSRQIFQAMGMAALICSAGAALAQGTAQAPATPFIWQPGYIEPGLPKPPYVPPETPQGSGPHPAIMAAETVAPGEDFVSYYPANLSQLGGKKLPIVMWANGSCLYVGNRTRHFLQDIASHDYLVLAGGILVVGDKAEDAENIDMSVDPLIPNPDPPANAAPAPARAAPVTTQQQYDMSNDPTRKRVTHELLDNGIKWAIAENKRPGSKFFGKLDTANIAVMGTSCGGGVTGTFAGDPRVKTLGVWNSGFGTNAELRAKLKQPLLNITGDPRYDIAYWGGIKGFEALRDNNVKTPVFYGWRVNMVHMGTYRQTNGGEMAPLAEAWLDWRLKGDQTAAKWFTGAKCGLCTNTHYHIDRLNIK
jgi:dienelactone hydrolase